MLDKGATTSEVEGILATAGDYIDVVKLGWGISYVDLTAKERVRLYQSAGVVVSTGGTLLEVAVAQGRLTEFRQWATELGVEAVEVSNGLGTMSPSEKTALVAELSRDVLVLAEAGSKEQTASVEAGDWIDEMAADLAAGARWVIAEGRESGTVGLYEADGAVREALVTRLVAGLPRDRIIFEAPRKSQQVWFLRRLGGRVNLGNIAPDEVLPLETLRLGLRADTAGMHLASPGRP